jgi:hypothetical protein
MVLLFFGLELVRRAPGHHIPIAGDFSYRKEGETIAGRIGFNPFAGRG